MKAVSLFAGVGGFEIGFERAGIETVLQAESDPWCLQVLERHWPDTERVTDVRDVGCHGEHARRESADSVRKRAGRGRREAWPRLSSSVDLIYGGFPCQDVSVAGKRAGFRGERSSLWHEFHRVLRELRPRWTVIENVPGLLSSNSGRDFATVLLGLEELGYGWAYRILDARWFGVPQRRRRVFVVGCLGDAPRAAQVLAVCESCGGHPAPSSQTREAVAASLRSRSSSTGVNMPGRGGEDDANLIAFQSNTGSRLADELSEEYFGPVRKGSGGSSAAPPAISSGAGIRRLTPLECERLQGWPDDWTRYAADGTEISDSHRYRMCGNGVVATVAEWLGWRLMAADRLAVERAA